jgi:hypothetical protein
MVTVFYFGLHLVQEFHSFASISRGRLSFFLENKIKHWSALSKVVVRQPKFQDRFNLPFHQISSPIKKTAQTTTCNSSSQILAYSAESVTAENYLARFNPVARVLTFNPSLQLLIGLASQCPIYYTPSLSSTHYQSH